MKIFATGEHSAIVKMAFKAFGGTVTALKARLKVHSKQKRP